MQETQKMTRLLVGMGGGRDLGQDGLGHLGRMVENEVVEGDVRAEG